MTAYAYNYNTIKSKLTWDVYGAAIYQPIERNI